MGKNRTKQARSRSNSATIGGVFCSVPCGVVKESGPGRYGASVQGGSDEGTLKVDASAA